MKKLNWSHWWIYLGWFAIIVVLLLQSLFVTEVTAAPSRYVKVNAGSSAGKYINTQNTSWSDYLQLDLTSVGNLGFRWSEDVDGTPAAPLFNAMGRSFLSFTVPSLSAGESIQYSTMSLYCWTWTNQTASNPVVKIVQFSSSAMDGADVSDYEIENFTGATVVDTIYMSAFSASNRTTWILPSTFTSTLTSGQTVYLGIYTTTMDSGSSPSSTGDAKDVTLYFREYNYATTEQRPYMEFFILDEPYPAEPTDVELSIEDWGTTGQKMLTLTWSDESNNEDFFQIQSSTTGNYDGAAGDIFYDFKRLDGSEEAWIQIINEYLDENYYVRIRAGTNEGTYSDWVNATPYPFETERPKKPTDLSLAWVNAGSTNAISVTWNDVSDNETNFIIVRVADEDITTWSYENTSSYSKFTVGQNVESYTDTLAWAPDETRYWYMVGSYSSTLGYVPNFTDLEYIDLGEYIPPNSGSSGGLWDWDDYIPWAGESWFPWLAMVLCALAVFGALATRVSGVIGIAGALTVVVAFIVLGWVDGTLIIVGIVSLAAIVLARKVFA